MTTAPPSAAARHLAPPALEEIADQVHAYLQPPGGWCLNNAGLVAGATGAVLVDTAATEHRSRALRAAVRRHAPDGPDHVVNTHFHGDHTFGNALFLPRATIVAHERTRADAEAAGLALCGLWPDVAWGTVDVALPTLTFHDGLTLRTGGPTVELLALAPAHTAGDVVAWVPERRVLFAGDLVWSGVTPYVLMGSVDGSLRALDELRALRPRVVVPGHGAPGGPELFDETEAYLRWLKDLARRGLADGRPAREVARTTDPGPFARLLDSERLVGNLHRAYAELEGLPPGAPLDVMASFREMVDLHGGLPACHA
ncbi:MBL fold metallo-hydrolase [Streptomyces sp. NPDC001595]|uniref:MBL fold metallo-hydrolase n=1 Tax=Streptomyces sp. NPDC001532 TaxID=3154520 RepID=UPI00332A51D6